MVCERVVGGHGVRSFLVSLALALPLTIAFARMVAAVFERPFMHRGQSLNGPRDVAVARLSQTAVSRP